MHLGIESMNSRNGCFSFNQAKKIRLQTGNIIMNTDSRLRVCKTPEIPSKDS